MTPFKSVLVANRGEIALRVLRSARDMGYRTLAVYSEAEADAPHVRAADDAACIGPAPAGQSYLSADAILKAAVDLGANAIHPGYGFLSENAEFAERCKEAGLIFIGPDPDAISLMGNKAEAKRRMIKAGVPCVPGYEGKDQNTDALIAAAEGIGYPLMVKAAAGGGGRGMRLVDDAKALPKALKTARAEAQNAFGSGELILEKAILRPRHVEVQVFGDAQGNTVHLGERDCSVQRRHQKVIEEAPCPVMTPDLRSAMGYAAVEAARAIGYRGAGTVEFLLDDQGGFYFLEMNTRLQVEHPVTEMITGLDLVALQLQVAEGHPLPFTQGDVVLNGHAIEARLYAEDPAMSFMPRTGRIALWEPAPGEGVRYDVGVESGQEVSPFYDPMIGKVIAWGPTRDAARRRLVSALKNSLLFGLTTNKRFLVDVLEADSFAAGEATTAFIEETYTKTDLADPKAGFADATCAAALLYSCERDALHAQSVGVPFELLNWGSGGHLATRYVMQAGDRVQDVIVSPEQNNQLRVTGSESACVIDVVDRSTTRATLRINGSRADVGYLWDAPGAMTVSRGGIVHSFQNTIAVPIATRETNASGEIVSLMPGLVLDVMVKVGATVAQGDILAVIETMKMQHEVRTQVDGVVRDVTAAIGDQVTAGASLLNIEVSAQ